MTDNEITREKTFSEELPYFKEQIKEVFDNYHNLNGYEDPLYIAVLRDSNRIVRKAEEEINRQKAEIDRLQKEVNLVSIQFQDLQERYEEHREEIERLKGSVIVNNIMETQKIKREAKSEAVKEFAKELKNILRNIPKWNVKKLNFNNVGFSYDDVFFSIDNLVKEMECEINE